MKTSAAPRSDSPRDSQLPFGVNAQTGAGSWSGWGTGIGKGMKGQGGGEWRVRIFNIWSSCVLLIPPLPGAGHAAAPPAPHSSYTLETPQSGKTDARPRQAGPYISSWRFKHLSGIPLDLSYFEQEGSMCSGTL
jgi:hypothetical protein